MILKELMTQLPELRDAERLVLKRLALLLTPVTTAEWIIFQENWDVETRTYEEFVVAQNEMIAKCVEDEKSDSGTAIRAHFGLDPLTDETVIPESAEEDDAAMITEEVMIQTRPEGHIINVFYNHSSKLLVVDVIHSEGKVGNEILRKTLNFKSLLKHKKWFSMFKRNKRGGS